MFLILLNLNQLMTDIKKRKCMTYVFSYMEYEAIRSFKLKQKFK